MGQDRAKRKLGEDKISGTGRSDLGKEASGEVGHELKLQFGFGEVLASRVSPMGIILFSADIYFICYVTGIFYICVKLCQVDRYGSILQKRK